MIIALLLVFLGRVLKKKVSDDDQFDSYAASTSSSANDPTVQAVNSIIERLTDIDEQIANLSVISEERKRGSK